MISMKKEILGCMKCGSNRLESSPGGAYAAQTELGISGGVSGQMLCKKCGNLGYPLEFDSEKIRKEYEKKKSIPAQKK